MKQQLSANDVKMLSNMFREWLIALDKSDSALANRLASSLADFGVLEFDGSRYGYENGKSITSAKLKKEVAKIWITG